MDYIGYYNAIKEQQEVVNATVHYMTLVSIVGLYTWMRKAVIGCDVRSRARGPDAHGISEFLSVRPSISIRIKFTQVLVPRLYNKRHIIINGMAEERRKKD